MGAYETILACSETGRETCKIINNHQRVSNIITLLKVQTNKHHSFDRFQFLPRNQLHTLVVSQKIPEHYCIPASVGREDALHESGCDIT